MHQSLVQSWRDVDHVAVVILFCCRWVSLLRHYHRSETQELRRWQRFCEKIAGHVISADLLQKNFSCINVRSMAWSMTCWTFDAKGSSRVKQSMQWWAGSRSSICTQPKLFPGKIFLLLRAQVNELNVAETHCTVYSDGFNGGQWTMSSIETLWRLPRWGQRTGTISRSTSGLVKWEL